MQVVLVDLKKHLDDLLTRYPISPFVSQTIAQRLNTLSNKLV